MKVKKSWSGLTLAHVLGGCHVGVVLSGGRRRDKEFPQGTLDYLGIIPNVAKVLSS